MTNIRILVIGTMLCLGSFLLVAAATSHAQLKNNVCGGADLTLSGSTECASTNAGPGNDLTALIGNIVDVLSVIVGIVAVIMIIYGGFKFITAGGDAGRVTSARNTILYALVGLIIVAFAQIIVRFVLTKTPT